MLGVRCDVYIFKLTASAQSINRESMIGIIQGILTYRRYTQREFKLKFSALLKAYDGKYTENSKKQLFEWTLS